MAALACSARGVSRSGAEIPQSRNERQNGGGKWRLGFVGSCEARGSRRLIFTSRDPSPMMRFLGRGYSIYMQTVNNTGVMRVKEFISI